MDSVLAYAHPPSQLALISLVVLFASLFVWRAAWAVFLHPLAAFPGPVPAAISTYWQAFAHLVAGPSFHEQLDALHKRHGDIVRIGPNELHFADPQAYHDIYNSANKWDKEESLYHSFGEDRSSFGFLDYKSAKERKDILNRSFSAKAIEDSESLVQQKVDRLCETFRHYHDAGRTINASRAFRCFTIDVITHLCFGIAIDAIAAPEFAAPIIVAMDESMKILPAFRFFPLFKSAILDCPPRLSRIVSPLTAGLIDLQQIIRGKIDSLSSRPDTLHSFPHTKTIFHTLLSPEAHKSGVAPDPASLYEESQALMFGGGDTAGNALMVTLFHLLRRPDAMARLQAELRAAWPALDAPPPSQRQLEALPYLHAVLREGLRLSLGVVSGLLRVVPAPGAAIAGAHIPAGTIVSISSPFVHLNPTLFADPHAFRPERWLDPSAAASLAPWLVPFGRGPRSCLGVNLAWLELRLLLANLARRFDLALDPASPDVLKFRAAFLPRWTSKPVRIRAKPVAA